MSLYHDEALWLPGCVLAYNMVDLTPDGKLKDQSPYQNPGELTDTVLSGRVRYFNGTSAFININKTPTEMKIVKELTILVWAQRDIITGNQWICAPGDSGAINILDLIGLGSDYGVGVRTTDGYVQLSGGAMDTDWHFWALSYDGANIFLRIDGKLKASNPQTGNLSTTNMGDLVFGRFGLGGTGWWQGKIGPIVMLNRALSSDIITVRYHRGRLAPVT